MPALLSIQQLYNIRVRGDGWLKKAYQQNVQQNIQQNVQQNIQHNVQQIPYRDLLFCFVGIFSCFGKITLRNVFLGLISLDVL